MELFISEGWKLLYIQRVEKNPPQIFLCAESYIFDGSRIVGYFGLIIIFFYFI